MEYTVKTDIFEGPFDLLLTLIEKRKLFINDIALAEVSDDFISYIEKEKQRAFPMGQIADFLLIAATLLLIKSKSLLPGLTLTEEETESIEDLERRLALYKRIRSLSRKVQEQFGINILFGRAGNLSEEAIFSPHESITTKNIHDAIRRVLVNLPKEEKMPMAKVQQVMSLEEMVDKLSERIRKTLNVSFKEFAQIGKEEKVNVIVGFLAMLELVKQGVITARQEGLFSDIMMESQKIDTPQYG